MLLIYRWFVGFFVFWFLFLWSWEPMKRSHFSISLFGLKVVRLCHFWLIYSFPKIGFNSIKRQFYLKLELTLKKFNSMKNFRILLSLFLVVFGCISVFMTTSIIFDLFGIREMEGNFVYPIIYANLFCGLLYLYSAYAIWNYQKTAIYALSIALVVLIVSFVWFLIYIQSGGIHEVKTIKAMSFRTIITFIVLIFAYKIAKIRKNYKG